MKGAWLLLAFVVGQASATSVRDVTTSAARYLAEYQLQSAFLLADEQSTQRVLDGNGREIVRRSMTSETFQTFVASSRAWLTIRDVIEVDGIKIDDREDIRALLHDSSAPGLALKLAQRNARFNLGSVSRNFNEPTLGLLVLEPERRPQFRFERRRVEQTAGAPLVTLSFKEVDRPTLIRSVAGPSVYSTGELLIEADTGRIEKTTIRFKHESILASLTTEYTHDAKLEMWVPGIFKERYEQTRAPREVVECESRYTNYRRFDVTSRIR